MEILTLGVTRSLPPISFVTHSTASFEKMQLLEILKNRSGSSPVMSESIVESTM